MYVLAQATKVLSGFLGWSILPFNQFFQDVNIVAREVVFASSKHAWVIAMGEIKGESYVSY